VGGWGMAPRRIPWRIRALLLPEQLFMRPRACFRARGRRKWDGACCGSRAACPGEGGVGAAARLVQAVSVLGLGCRANCCFRACLRDGITARRGAFRECTSHSHLCRASPVILGGWTAELSAGRPGRHNLRQVVRLGSELSGDEVFPLVPASGRVQNQDARLA
jgi:hypothetical protein